ncbi:MAG: hypothetical protein AMS21_11300 [Gemmatimonas sp. SG8_38_2]|jgi:hypothetical protein|nr:MAG: hypothetical protein AMS21_11300 [Gemmatimonas sp. SG8_38_2]
MDLSQLADLGELVGGVAVVLSLVYLAAQIRQNTRTVRASTLHQNTELWSSLFLRLAEPDLARAYVAGMAGQQDIKPLQYTQFFFVCRGMFLAFENQYYQMRHGVLDPAAYAGYERSISTQLLAFRGFRLWWEMNRSVFSPEFVDHVDAMVADVPEADPASMLRRWRDIASARTPAV